MNGVEPPWRYNGRPSTKDGSLPQHPLGNWPRALLALWREVSECCVDASYELRFSMVDFCFPETLAGTSCQRTVAPLRL
jgi:hypothetical protein